MDDEARKTCETCRFMKPAVYGGQCFRMPPVPAFQCAFDGSGAIEFQNMRPWVSNNEWCGEYQRSPA